MWSYGRSIAPEGMLAQVLCVKVDTDVLCTGNIRYGKPTNFRDAKESLKDLHKALNLPQAQEEKLDSFDDKTFKNDIKEICDGFFSQKHKSEVSCA